MKWNDLIQRLFQLLEINLSCLGGKRMLGSTNSMYIRPAEFSSLMVQLIDVINNDRIPNPDSLIERYLRDRFVNDIVREQKALFEQDLFTYAANTVCIIITNRKRPETEEEHAIADEEMSNARKQLTRQYISKMIGAARFNIFGLDLQMSYDYRTRDDEQEALKELPKSIQTELISIESSMDHFKKPEMLIEELRSKMIIADARQREEQARKIAMEAEEVRKQQQALAEEERKKTDALRTETEKAAEAMREAQANAQRFKQQAEEHRAAAEQALAEHKKAVSAKENYQKEAEEHRRIAEREKAEEAKYEAAAAEEKRKAEEAKRKSLLTENDRPKQWLVKTDLCPTCKAYSTSNNVVHNDCPSGRAGNWYYYDRGQSQMVCEACKTIITCKPEDVVCGRCQTRVRVIQVL
jgi:myosin heavy subunit